MKCIIVDDEPLAIEVIEAYVKSVGEMDIAAKCTNALKAFEVLQREKIDLMFLDIQMPKLSGINFLKTLSNPPKVILTTAYRDYAIEGYELDVVDYLLKPISLERFLKAINKFYSQVNSKSVVEQKISSSTEHDFIYIKSNRKMLKVFLSNIILIEGMKDYLMITTTDSKITTKEKMSDIESKLCKGKFIRVHKSFIISVDKIDAVTPHSIEIGRKEIPIGRSYKQAVFGKLGC